MQKILSLYAGADISAANLVFITSKLERLFVKRGQIIAAPGSICEHLFLVESGLFRCYLMDEDKEYTLFFRKEGEVLTDYRSFVRHEPAQLYMQALEDAEVYKLSALHLQEIFGKVPVMMKMNYEILEDYYARLLDDFTLLFAGDATKRFEKFMQHHASIAHRVPQHIIANYLRITPTHLSRLKRQETK
jgi:CRP-like cAMP-binding protein